MKFYNYLNEKTINVKQILTLLSKLPYNKSETLMKKSFNQMINFLKKNNIENKFLSILNKSLKTNYKTLKDISNLNEEYLNEDFSNFWKMFKMEGWGAVSIFPTLSLWFEFDKLLDDANITDLNFKKIIIYGTFWLLLLLGKHINGYNKWKKENPEEFEKEGKPGIFIKKNK